MITPRAIKNFFSTKLALGVLVVVLLFLVFQFSQVFYQRYATDKEISDYQKEIAQLEGQQKHLNDALTFLNTDFFAEREARTKLGMQKAGEKVLVLPEERLGNRVSDDTVKPSKKAPIANADDGVPSREVNATSNGPTVVIRNNPTRWWGYFFGDN